MNRFSQLVSIFHNRTLPELGCSLAGYAALINAYALNVPLPDQCSVISTRHKRYATAEWVVYTPRHKPDDTLVEHLVFALKYEGVDLAVLNALFNVIKPQEIASWVQSEPTGRYSRRLWFLYEWLTATLLDCDDAKTGNIIDLLDAKLQYPGPSIVSKRHRVRNNLPGVRDFCPLIRCTPILQQYIALHLNTAALAKIQQTPYDLLARASAFLLLKDSRASFQIEQESAEEGRAERWGQALGQAGQHPLSIAGLLQLQKIVLDGNRFITLGFRQEGGFVGHHNRFTGAPVPDHISARSDDIDRLINGMIATNQHLLNSSLDPILIATMIAFGFVFIHPFIDGNGRIHRYLMQHVIAEHGFVPHGLIFPLSVVILQRIDEYRQVLESYSHPRLACIEWQPTNKGNVAVLNQTIDLYRYFDATRQAEFLYSCMNQAVEQDFPEEIDYLKRYDHLKAAIKRACNMPDHLVSLLIRFLQQNNGILSKRARNSEFKALTAEECTEIEELYATTFK